MKISVSSNNVNFTPQTIESLDHLCEVILKSNWSPAIFLDNYRKRLNFMSSEVIGLDVDGGCSLEEALEIFKDYKHIIATTKSHQVEKHGIIADRFRVILFLEEAANLDDFEATLRDLMEKLDFLDEACKDGARFFYPSTQIVSVNETGLRVSKKTRKNNLPVVSLLPLKPLTDEQKGRLARSTLEFLVEGAEPGTWNARLFKAAKDFQEQGFTELEFLERAEKVTGFLDNVDLSTIKSAFTSVAKYEPRLVTQQETEVLFRQPAIDPETLVLRPSDFASKAMNYLSNKELVMGEPTGLDGLDHLLGGGKRLGEITALTATAKAGKSALMHFLIHKMIKKGIPVGFASREMSPETEVTPNLLSLSFEENAWKTEMNPGKAEAYVKEMMTWPLFFTKGYGYLQFNEFKEWLVHLNGAYGVQYFVLDHLLYSMANPEDFKEVSLFMRELKAFFNEKMFHLDLIIQPKNIGLGERIGANSLRGGANISQAINTLLTLERVPEQKNISKLTLEIGRSRLCRQGTIYLQYNPETTGFMEVEAEPQDPVTTNDVGPRKLHSIGD